MKCNPLHMHNNIYRRINLCNVMGVPSLGNSRKSQKSSLISNLDGPIRANQFADSRESPDSRESFQGSRTEPLFANRASGGRGGGGLKIAIRANCSHVMKVGVFFLRTDSRESPRFALRIAGPSKCIDSQNKFREELILTNLALQA